MLLKVILGFIFGISGGIYLFSSHVQKHLPVKKVLSESIELKDGKEPVNTSTTPTAIQLPPTETVSTPTEDPSPTITFTKTPSPTKKYTPTLTPTKTPSPTIIITNTNTPTLTPSIPPTPQTENTTELVPATSSEINSYIDRFSVQYAVDPNVLRHIAVCESGFRPLALNGPYAGLYQFSSNTWISYRIKMGEITDEKLRLNAEEAVQTAAYVMSVGNSSIWPNCIP